MQRPSSCINLCLLPHISSGVAASLPALLFSPKSMVPRHLEYIIPCQHSETETSPSGSTPQKSCNIGITIQIFPKGEAGSWGFSPIHFALSWGEVVSEFVLVQTIAFVLRVLQTGAHSYSALRFSKRETSPLDRPLKSLNVRHMF